MTGSKRSGKIVLGTLLGASLLLFSAVPTVTAATTGYLSYQVQPGDFLWLIGNKYSVSTDEIISVNGLTSTTIYPGQVLMIPGDDDTAESPGGAIRYTVQKGDSLYFIGQRYGVTAEQILQASGLSSAMIYPGQQLLIPSSSKSGAYKVQKGDSLYLIAQKYGTDVDSIVRLNNLTSMEIWVDQELLIPGHSQSGSGSGGSPVPNDSGSSDGNGVIPPVNQIDFSKPLPVIGQWNGLSDKLVLYTVKQGDNLWGIAQKYGTTSNAIKATNHLHSEILQVDQPLFIPQNSSQSVSVSNPAGTVKSGYGELMDWKFADWILDTSNTATIKDIVTGKSFQIKRYGGSSHCDSEPLTAADAAVMKSIYGEWSWNPRAVLVTVGGKTLAASMAGMPHSYDSIPENNFAGHFDLYFLNSRSHNNNSLDEGHQRMVLKAAGY